MLEIRPNVPDHDAIITGAMLNLLSSQLCSEAFVEEPSGWGVSQRPYACGRCALGEKILHNSSQQVAAHALSLRAVNEIDSIDLHFLAQGLFPSGWATIRKANNSTIRFGDIHWKKRYLFQTLSPPFYPDWYRYLLKGDFGQEMTKALVPGRHMNGRDSFAIRQGGCPNRNNGSYLPRFAHRTSCAARWTIGRGVA